MATRKVAVGATKRQRDGKMHDVAAHTREMQVPDSSVASDSAVATTSAAAYDDPLAQAPFEGAKRHLNPDGTIGGWVGPNTYVEEGCTIEADCEVRDSGQVINGGVVSYHSSVRENAVIDGGYLNDNSIAEGNAYLGHEAVAEDISLLTDSAIVTSGAQLTNTVVRDSGRVSDRSDVRNSTISDYAEVSGKAEVKKSKLSGMAQVGSHAKLDDCTMSDDTVATGKSALYNCDLEGNVEVGGTAKVGHQSYNRVRLTGDQHLTEGWTKPDDFNPKVWG